VQGEIRMQQTSSPQPFGSHDRGLRAWLARLAALAALLAGCAGVFSGCAGLPAQPERTASTALTDTADTPLGKVLALRLAQHPGESLFYPLTSGPDALAARLAMARAAQRSLDLQAYIFDTRNTGAAVLGDIIDAAERGVRVRLLIDDLHTEGMDKLLAAVDSHPNIEVRLFNPFAGRSARWLQLLGDFGRLDRRMHNKSMTVDNQLSLVGGRNIGDAYFSARADIDYSDLDVLIAGPAVPQVSAAFDEYWNSELSYPVAALIREGKDAPVEIRSLRKRLEAKGDQAHASPFVQELLHSGLAKEIETGHMPAYSGTATVVADKPDKATQQAGNDGDAIARLEQLISRATREVVLVSPYFVPDDDGEALLIALAKRGIHVRILTNSYAATDVRAVHAGYVPHREALLAAGIEVYELKPNAYAELVGQSRRSPWPASSRATLHAKNYIVDQRLVFIGSLNMDPRSARLNTETEVVLDSPALTQRILKGMESRLQDIAYRVELHADADGSNRHLIWITHEQGQEKTYDSEPGMTALGHLGIGVMRILPIKEEL